MEKNNKQNRKNYDLKSDAVESLVNADSGAVPEFSRAELEKYRSRKGFRIPDTVKILFIKAWFAGAGCYFFLWGLGTYVSAMLDMIFVLGVAMGLVTDLLTNNVIRFIEKTPGQHSRWMMVPRKGMAGFVLNILYSFVLVLCVYMLYNVINYIIVGVTGAADSVPLGVEPILFGIFWLVFDLIWIGCKRLMGAVIRDAKKAAGAGGKGN